jgi:hypothetical protein
MKRRALLTTHLAGVVILLTGCTGGNDRSSPKNSGDVGKSPEAELEMAPVTDAEIAKRTTYRIDQEHRTAERELIASVTKNGSKDVTATSPPVPENRPLVYDGSVFEFSYEVVESYPATTFRITLSGVDEDNGSDERLEYSSLPTVDKRRLERYGWDDGGPFEGAGVAVTYPDDSIPTSALVPKPEHSVLEWGPDRYALITVERAGDKQMKTYRYTARKLHQSASEFGQGIREDYEITLDALSDEQQTIVSEAIRSADGYEINEDEPPKAFEQLANRFPPSDELFSTSAETSTASPTSGLYIVCYEGAVYWTRLVI